jgi:hypothetical protein
MKKTTKKNGAVKPAIEWNQPPKGGSTKKGGKKC